MHIPASNKAIALRRAGENKRSNQERPRAPENYKLVAIRAANILRTYLQVIWMINFDIEARHFIQIDILRMYLQVIWITIVDIETEHFIQIDILRTYLQVMWTTIVDIEARHFIQIEILSIRNI